jgi:hypothetical protein
MPAGDHNFSGGSLCLFYITGHGAGEKLKKSLHFPSKKYIPICIVDAYNRKG